MHRACNIKSRRDQQLAVPVKHNTQITQRQFQPQLVHSGRKDYQIYQSQLIQFFLSKDSTPWHICLVESCGSTSKYVSQFHSWEKYVLNSFACFKVWTHPFVCQLYKESIPASLHRFSHIQVCPGICFIMFLGSGDFMWNENNDYD